MDDEDEYKTFWLNIFKVSKSDADSESCWVSCKFTATRLFGFTLVKY